MPNKRNNGDVLPLFTLSHKSHTKESFYFSTKYSEQAACWTWAKNTCNVDFNFRATSRRNHLSFTA